MENWSRLLLEKASKSLVQYSSALWTENSNWLYYHTMIKAFHCTLKGRGSINYPRLLKNPFFPHSNKHIVAVFLLLLQDGNVCFGNSHDTFSICQISHEMWDTLKLPSSPHLLLDQTSPVLYRFDWGLNTCREPPSGTTPSFHRQHHQNHCDLKLHCWNTPCHNRTNHDRFVCCARQTS